MGDKRNYAALDWVLGEIGETLKDARQALEAYVEDPRDTARIRFCLTHIHQVHGSLQMVEFHGASLFAEEMELLTAAIMHNKVSNEKEAQEVLMRSLLQLPLYLEQVKANHDDHPAIVMPLLNDLRAVRKQPYLSETNLFHPDLSSVGRVTGQRHSSLDDIPRLKPVLKKLQDMYQFAAASVLRGIKIDEHLGYIDKVFARLESITRGTLCHPTWYAAAALTEALTRDDVELSVAVRGLLRHLAREIKVLNEHCPAAFDAPPPEPLLRNLLYYVGLARAGGIRVAAVKQRFQLEQSTVLPGGSSSHSMLSAPEPEAVRAVVAALQEELNSAKFLMDRALSGQGSMSEVEETLPFIKRISDTLAVLGIVDMRKHTLEQHNALVQMCKTGTISDSVLIDVAGRLADLENRLEAIGKGKASDYTRIDERAVEIDTAKHAVLNECRNGMDVVKEAIIESMSAKWDPSFLPRAVETLNDIRGGFNMVPLPRPAAILDACGQFIQRELIDRETNPGDALQTLAEAIASVDYYLERLIGGHGDDLDGYLEMAEESLTELGYRPKGADTYVRSAAPGVSPGVEAPDETRFDETTGAAAHPGSALDADEATEVSRTVAADESFDQQESAALAVSSEVADANAGFENRGDSEGYPAAPEDAVTEEAVTEEAVTGSVDPGAVEANPVAAETHAIDTDEETIDADADIASAAETFAWQDASEQDSRDDPEHAGALFAAQTGDDDLAGADGIEAAPTVTATAADAEEEEESEIDEEIIEIFVEEAAEVQETLADYFPRWSNNLDDQNSLITVRRSFHTLKGSGRMVEAMEVGELAWSVENMLNRIMDNSIKPQSAHIELIEKVLVVLPDLITAFKDRRPNPHKALTDQYINWAARLAKGEIPADMAGNAELGVVKPDDADSDDNEDQILWDIFASEATTHLDVVRGFIAAMDEQSPIYDVPSDDLQRALHTLKGSAHMAAVTPIAAMTAPLENFVKELRTYQVRVDDDILQLIRDSVQYTQEGLGCIERGEPVELPKLDQFIARVRELRDDHVAPLIHLRDHEREGEKPVDPRLLAIFMAEEMNLLLDAHKIMADWASGQTTPQPAIERLIEELGTLSEGASQANLPTMAMLSCQLKKLHATALKEGLATDSGFFTTVNPAHDTLLDMVDAVAAGQNVPAVDADLQSRLDSLMDLVPAEPEARLAPTAIDADAPEETLAEFAEPEADSLWSHDDEMDAIDLGADALPVGDGVGDQVGAPVGADGGDEVAYDFGEDAGMAFADEGQSVEDEYQYLPAGESTPADAEDAPLLTDTADAVDWSVDAPQDVEITDPTSVDDETWLVEQGDDLSLTGEIPEDAPELTELSYDEAGDERLFLGDPEGTLSRLEDEAMEDEDLLADDAPVEETLIGDWAREADFDAGELIIDGAVEPAVLVDRADDDDDEDDDVIEIELPFDGDTARQEGLLAEGDLHAVDELYLEEEQPLAAGIVTDAPTAEVELLVDEDALADDGEPLAEDEIYIDGLHLGAEPVQLDLAGDEDDLEFDLAQLESDLRASEAVASAADEDLDNIHHEDYTPADYATAEYGMDATDDATRESADLTDEEMEEAQRLEDFTEAEALLDDDFASSAADMHAEKHETGPALSPWELGSPAQLAAIETDDYDQDILEIFLEEANELIEELDEAIHAWESDHNAEAPADTMKRVLHTLKGGARLSGLMNFGELTHNYESFLIATRHPSDNEAFFPLIHQYQDLLLNGVKAVRARLDGLPLADDSAVQPAAETPATEQSPAAALRESLAEGQVLPFIPRAPAPRPEFVPFPEPSEAAPESAVAPARPGSQEMVKVSADLLEELVNLAGETTISRGRLEQQVSDLTSAVDEIETTLGRLSEQLRRLDMETEAQVLFRQERMASYEEFDPLEMDRYSQLQQLTRSLMESASDLVDLKHTLGDKLRDTETLLLQQSRITSSLQEGLMRSRMVPFSRLVPRLRRIVRQVAAELGKQVNVEFDNVEGEMDRSVLERMVAPLEHMLRNAVDHGIEQPDDRVAAGKPPTGRVLVSLAREGGDILLRLADDGRGVNIKRVREKAIERGLMAEDSNLSDYDVMQFILQAGFSTAENVTQISGRGVGMDVVASEIKQLGGSVGIDSRPGVGTQFIVRLPFTVSVNRALMVQLGGETFAIALNSIEGIVRVSPFELEHYYTQPDAFFEYAGDSYQVRHLNGLITPGYLPRLDGQILPLPVILVRSAQHTMAMQVDGLMGSKEIVVKSLGPQFASVQGLSGATVMGDGSVVVILDVHALVRREVALLGSGRGALGLATQPEPAPQKVAKTVMVVDDSVTVRKVTTRFLEREGYHVITAKDGVDALQVLQENIPDLMLLDIEMPRMDGFEVARNVRSSSRWKHIPIIMITSRTGDKHRQHALSLGVNEYLGKPYQEDVLSKLVTSLLAKQTMTA